MGGWGGEREGGRPSSSFNWLFDSSRHAQMSLTGELTGEMIEKVVWHRTPLPCRKPRYPPPVQASTLKLISDLYIRARACVLTTSRLQKIIRISIQSLLTKFVWCETMQSVNWNGVYNMNIIHYCDPGHGWFKVSRSLLKKLGIETKISGYSYQRADMAYLEEDCDASLLLQTLDDKGIEWSIKVAHTDKMSRIRNYRRFEVAA